MTETEKNAQKRRNGNPVPAQLKSRLAGSGKLEETAGLRTDSPTADADAHKLVFSSCHDVKVESADAQAARLQGKWVAGISFSSSNLQGSRPRIVVEA